MMTIDFVLLVLALILFALEAFNVQPWPPINRLALGLALWVLTLLV